MPTYEYECEKCGNKFDLFQKMTDKPAKTCPECGGKAERLISVGSGFIFKGPGFYATDYKNKKRSEEKGPCPAPKSDGCKSCSLNKEKDDKRG